MNRRHPAALALVLLMVFGPPVAPLRAAEPLTGWLLGSWVFDEETTARHYQEKKAEGLDALVYGQLVDQLRGATLRFTGQELTMLTKAGDGKAFGIQEASTSAPDALTVKQTDGDITTYHREAGCLWFSSTGSVNLPFYFKRPDAAAKPAPPG